MANDPRFLSPMGSRLKELGLDVKDVNVGRYIQIDLSKPRPEPEEFAEFGEFDTFVVLNPHELPAGAKVWLYFNNKRPESRMPLHRLSRLETIADRFYLQHNDSWEGVTLEILIGGDLRALNVDPRDKGTVTLESASIDVTDRPERQLGNVSVPGVATELTLDAVRALLEFLVGTDFATENTLSTLAGKDFATEAKLEAVRAILASLEGKDFATESTLSTLAGTDFATETTLSGVKAATEEIGRKHLLLTDEPVTGEKTITATASPLYAGASPLSGRRQLSVYNDGDHPFYIGGAGVSSLTGFPVFPGQSVTVHFDPDIYVPLYAVTESGESVAVRIWESR